jgi:hypothetical protein
MFLKKFPCPIPVSKRDLGNRARIRNMSTERSNKSAILCDKMILRHRATSYYDHVLKNVAHPQYVYGSLQRRSSPLRPHLLPSADPEPATRQSRNYYHDAHPMIMKWFCSHERRLRRSHKHQESVAPAFFSTFKSNIRTARKVMQPSP